MTPRTTRSSIAAVLSGLLLLAGCSDSVVGAYRDGAGAVTYELHEEGRVHVTVLGATVTGTYTASREQVIVATPQGTTVLRRDGDMLLGPMGLVLHRVGAPGDSSAPALTRN